MSVWTEMFNMDSSTENKSIRKTQVGRTNYESPAYCNINPRA